MQERNKWGPEFLGALPDSRDVVRIAGGQGKTSAMNRGWRFMRSIAVEFRRGTAEALFVNPW
jgi:hypothetical protein